MRSIMLFLICASVFFVSGCAGKSLNPALEDAQAILKKQTGWEENRALMHAAEKSGNLNVIITTGTIELKERPDNDEARIIMARIYTRLGNPEHALRTLKPVKDTANIHFAMEKGRASLALRKITKAHAYLAIVFAAKDTELTREAEKLQAVAYDLEERHEEAQVQYRLLLAVGAEPVIQYNYGRSLMLSKKYDEAITVLLPLVDMPSLPHARLAAAACMVHSNNTAQARNLLEGYMPRGDIDRILKASK